MPQYSVGRFEQSSAVQPLDVNVTSRNFAQQEIHTAMLGALTLEHLLQYSKVSTVQSGQAHELAGDNLKQD